MPVKAWQRSTQLALLFSVSDLEELLHCSGDASTCISLFGNNRLLSLLSLLKSQDPYIMHQPQQIFRLLQTQARGFVFFHNDLTDFHTLFKFSFRLFQPTHQSQRAVVQTTWFSFSCCSLCNFDNFLSADTEAARFFSLWFSLQQLFQKATSVISISWHT